MSWLLTMGTPIQFKQSIVITWSLTLQNVLTLPFIMENHPVTEVCHFNSKIHLILIGKQISLEYCSETIFVSSIHSQFSINPFLEVLYFCHYFFNWVECPSFCESSNLSWLYKCQSWYECLSCVKWDKCGQYHRNKNILMNM